MRVYKCTAKQQGVKYSRLIEAGDKDHARALFIPVISPFFNMLKPIDFQVKLIYKK